MPQPTRNRIRYVLQLASALSVVVASGFLASTFAAPPTKKSSTKQPASTSLRPATPQAGFEDNTPLTEEQKIVHLLNRIGYGPRPGDVQRVQRMGIAAYIDQQMHAERIDDSRVEAKLDAFPILNSSNAELAAAYYDTLKTGLQAKQLQATITDRMKANGQSMEMMEPGELADATPEKRRENLQALYRNATPEERAKLQQAVQKRSKDGRRDSTQEASRALQIAKVIRATESDRQLYEVMCDFWSNHFNIDMRKNQCRVLKVSDERDVIRKNAMGKFRDLLGASAHSPAMMVYLDNATNVTPMPDDPRREKMRQRVLDNMAKNGDPLTQAIVATKRGKQGVNENYAREIMELHTLGVDGGYTQKDVQEVARCLTGWSVGNPRNGGRGEWVFNARNHDNGEKTVLGVTIPAGGGEADGEKVLDLLATNPATMRFISTKLCKRFVSDEPSSALIDKCVATWKRTDGDIPQIVRTIVTSPEFYSRAAYRQKIKSPFEYAVSSVRAVGGTFDLSRGNLQRTRLSTGKGGNLPAGGMNRTLVGQVATMGQPLYQYQAPTGYSEDSRKWVSTGALVARLNFALGLVRGDLVEISLPDPPLPAGSNAGAIVDSISREILNDDLSPSTRATLLKQANSSVDDESNAAGQTLEKRLMALVLGSPEFQRR